MADRLIERGGEGPRRARNLRTGVLLSLLACGMVGLAFASAPLYRLFCQVTGFAGTPQVADRLPETVAERRITVRFNADVSTRLPWRFQPVAGALTVKVGQPGLAFYRAENLAGEPVSGTATFNVTPLKAAQYFNKTQCFCFDEQRLAPGEAVDMGVSFFIDPAILEDRNLDDVTTVTLSYTFFRSLEEDVEAAAREHDDASGGAAAQRAVAESTGGGRSVF